MNCINTLHLNAYASAPGDDHPSRAGNQKATAEFVPLLNFAYNRWQGADFTANIKTGRFPITVKFTDTSTDTEISVWNWDFNNDGAVDDTLKSPSYTYQTTGNYTVNLTVTGTGVKWQRTKNELHSCEWRYKRFHYNHLTEWWGDVATWHFSYVNLGLFGQSGFDSKDCPRKGRHRSWYHCQQCSDWQQWKRILYVANVVVTGQQAVILRSACRA